MKNYPSLSPRQFIPSATTLPREQESVQEEKTAKKKQKNSARKLQRKLVLACIFLLAAATFFYGKWRESGGLYSNALPKVAMLENYKGTFANNPVKIINPREGEQGTSSYYLLYFEAFVIVEDKGELSIEVHKVSPNKLLKPGQAYTWKEMKEGVNQVPGVAHFITAVFENMEEVQTFHSFVLDNEKGIEFVPDFKKFTSDE